ncbi:hypothetical protein GmHk_08G023670 [Glycine max]|nr:hypothetical protein GmHk_08G023670 [Glycine max]
MVLISASVENLGKGLQHIELQSQLQDVLRRLEEKPVRVHSGAARNKPLQLLHPPLDTLLPPPPPPPPPPLHLCHVLATHYAQQFYIMYISN